MPNYRLTGIDRAGKLVLVDSDAATQQLALSDAFSRHDVASLTCSKQAHVVTQDCCSMKALADVADSGFGGLS